MYYFIVNPASRSGRGARLWQDTIEPALKEKHIKYEALFSEKQGDLTRLAKQIIQKAAKAQTDPVRLVVLGGDGTVNETLQGIAEEDNVTLSYIPTGSSNDLARDLRFPKDPLKVLEHLLEQPQTRSMDAGLLTTPSGERLFSVSCGIGFDAAVCQESMRSRLKDKLNRLGLGKLTYLGIALKQLFAAKTVSCDIFLEGREPVHIKKILFIAVMNHRYEGGGFRFCPDAVSDDGLLDLCVVRNLPKLLILFALPTAFWGKHYIFPGIDSYRTSSVQIRTSAPLWVHADGEVWERSDSISVSCRPGRIRFRF